MLLADLGADIVRVERPAEYAKNDGRRFEVMLRSRRSVPIDLKTPEGIEQLLALTDVADALIEGFRPGVMERLGVGPQVCRSRNEALVYARMTGWGQDGPLNTDAGHDINYISVAGCLAHLPAPDGVPHAPLNLIGDFGAGGTMLALGVVAAILEARNSGHGQVVDVSMVDGTAALMAMFHGYEAAREQSGAADAFGALRGAPFYAAYRCADDNFVSIGAAEPQFYRRLIEMLDLADAGEFVDQWDTSRWSTMSDRIAARIRTKTRDEWTEMAKDRDACLTPVLTLEEARMHPHLQHRGTFVTVDGVPQPAPPLRLIGTPAALPRSPASGRSTVDAVLGDWQCSPR
jgi:alpha-methylacyl-CoA racemase